MQHGKTDMIAQIHDEIIFQFDDDPALAQAAGNWTKAVMEVPPIPGFPVPIEAEASAAYSWGNKKDFSKWLEEKVNAGYIDIKDMAQQDAYEKGV